MLHIHTSKASAGLIQQLSAMHKDANAIAFTCRSLRNVAEYISLAAAGRQYRKHCAMPKLVLQAYISN
jgi:hypothetical protein